MTLTALLADCYRRLRYQTSPAADVVTRITAFVNETQQELARDPRLSSLLRGETAFTSVINQPEYGLSPQIARITRIRDASNRWPLQQVSLDWYRAILPNQTAQTGTPDRYALLGPKPVTRQPASATGVWVASTSGSDTTQTAYVEANRTGGYLSQASVTVNGSTRTQIGSQTDYEEITDFYLSAAAVGDVTLYDASTSGNVLGVIPKGQTRSTDQWIGLLPTPSAARTYQIDYERILSDLVNGTDEAYWIPARHQALLAIGARRKEYEYQQDERRQVADQEWTVAMQQLLAYVNNPPDYVMVPGGTRRSRSDLGAGYPAGTIWE